MKNNCEIIKDLSVLVKDGIATKESEKAVKEHIAECENCGNYYKSITDEIDLNKNEINIEDRQTKGIVSYGKKIKKIILGTVIVVGISVVAYIMIIVAFISAPFFFYDKNETTNISDYREFDTIHNEEQCMWSFLYVFPEKINNPDKVKSYYYYCDNKGLFDNSYQMYLESEFSEDEFKEEVKRLSEIKVKYEGDENSIVYNNNDFKYPAYVAIKDNDCTYEYALVDDENNRVMYVYTRFMYESDIKFDKEYLPKNFMNNPSGLKGDSIYRFSTFTIPRKDELEK
ncbi:zf-HC2 domain-containing protein [Clostridium gasigenes]|uniref:zf-HC2 domain-containing protein n=1 Tax=Clostridium gasigenes TaxID=94869 RepID=UPI001C0B947A|nr:zf-HC2 domain-containing protein [Clostridium gasigenes]MBU3105811.1 zf-HC2 domain-containing protein [Clostridium gasigenes]